jgi:ferredoxin
LHVVYSHPGEGDTRGRDFEHEGHIDVELLRRTLPNRRHQFYVCGPPPMMASLIPALEAWGIPKDDVRHEAFGPASVRVAVSVEAATDTEPLEIRFRQSGRTLVWQGEDANLLDFAERHGLVVESGCRSGSCGGCEVRVLSGAVRYAEKPDHEVPHGRCLLCVGTPASALELEA